MSGAEEKSVMPKATTDAQVEAEDAVLREQALLAMEDLTLHESTNGICDDPGLVGCPPWLPGKLRKRESRIARLEVTAASHDLYSNLLEYFGHRAVDIDEELPVPRELANGDNEEPDLNEREYTGTLSTLWSNPESMYDYSNHLNDRSSDSLGSGSDDDSDSDADSKDDPVAPPSFQMGLGYAHVAACEGAEDVYIHHYARGRPLSIDCTPRFFRAIVLFGREPDVLKALCTEAVEWQNARNKRRRAARVGKFLLYRFVTSGGGCSNWMSQGYKRSRALSSIILPPGQLDAIVEDFKEFAKKSTKRWYAQHGLPYRRSYLFHGPPGVGKTSTIRALAGALKLSACFLGLTKIDFSNQVLQDAVLTIPPNSILVLEDVDVFFNENRESNTGCMLTFSGLLNVLDGLVSGDGILTIMTTNHIERLDPALIRAGRVDRRFEFPVPSKLQIADLFLSFYPKASRGLCNEFANAVFKRPEKEARSIASLQQHFIFTRHMSPRESVDALPEFFKEFYPHGAPQPNSFIT